MKRYYGQVNIYTDLLRFSRFIIPFSIDGITVSLYYKCVPKVYPEIIRLNYYYILLLALMLRNNYVEISYVN